MTKKAALCLQCPPAARFLACALPAAVLVLSPGCAYFRPSPGRVAANQPWTGSTAEPDLRKQYPWADLITSVLGTAASQR